MKICRRSRWPHGCALAGKFEKPHSLGEETNAEGGINGKKIEVIIEDRQEENALAVTVAKLITPGEGAGADRWPRIEPGGGDRLGARRLKMPYLAVLLVGQNTQLRRRIAATCWRPAA